MKKKSGSQHYNNQYKKLSKYHKFGFTKKKNFSGPEKAAITRKRKELSGLIKAERENRIVYKEVSDTRKFNKVRKSNLARHVSRSRKGVFISINKKAIEKERGKRAVSEASERMTVNINEEGNIVFTYKGRRSTDISIDPDRLKEDPEIYIQEIIDRDMPPGASATLVINGSETGWRTDNKMMLLAYTIRIHDKIQTEIDREGYEEMNENTIGIRFHEYK